MLHPINKNELKDYVRKGQLEKVFEVLDTYEGSLKNELVLLETRYERFERNRRKGIISYEQYTLERNRFDDDLIALIDEIGNTEITEETGVNNSSKSSEQRVLNNHPLSAWVYLLAAFLLLFAVLGLTYVLSEHSKGEETLITEKHQNIDSLKLFYTATKDTINQDIKEETVDKIPINQPFEKVTENHSKAITTSPKEEVSSQVVTALQNKQLDINIQNIADDANKVIELKPEPKPITSKPEPIKLESTPTPKPKPTKLKPETTLSSKIYVQAASINAIFIDSTEVRFEPKTEAGIKKYYFDIPNRTKCSITVKSKHYTYKYFKKQDNSIIGLRPCSDDQLCKIN